MNIINDQAWKISFFRKLLWAFLAFAGGTLYAAALPPLNWNFAVFISLLPLLYCGCCFKWKFSAFCGWLWGIGWAFFSCNFLREIEWFVPFLIAPVLALWPALWAALLPELKRFTLFPAKAVIWTAKKKSEYFNTALPWYRIILFTVSSAVLFTLIEWTRSRLFVWNDFSATQYRNRYLIQIASLTGSYGIGFLIALVNAGIFGAVYFRKHRIAPLIVPALLTAATVLFGVYNIRKIENLPPSKVNLRAGLVQCDLSQRRRATEEQIVEAIDVCTALSTQLAEQKPELIIWPESAVPIPLESGGSIGDMFRRKFAAALRNSGIPVLAGLISFRPAIEQGVWDVTNSALLFTPELKLAGRYDKIHRVPYGEYVPFRKYLPQALINAVDMGRDLASGTNYEPINISPDIRASIAICYEGVFGYLTRKFALRDSNLLIVLSNDAWYPESSEPEQHLANAVIRAVETGLFMIRCGNNGGSGVVTPDGRFTQYIGSAARRPELLRERAIGIVNVPIYKNWTRRTIFVRYGEWFITLLGTALFALIIGWMIYRFKRKEYFKNLMENQNERTN